MESQKVTGVLEGLGAIFGNSRTKAKYGQSIRDRLDKEAEDRRKEELESKRRMEQMGVNLRVSLIPKYIEAAQDPNISDDQRAIIQTDLQKLMGGLGQEDIGGLAALMRPKQKTISSSERTALINAGFSPRQIEEIIKNPQGFSESPENANYTLPDGSMRFDAEGNLEAENPKDQNERNYWEARARRRGEDLAKEQKEIENSEESLSKKIKLALLNIKKEQNDDYYGKAEAARKRQQIEKYSSAAKKADDALKRVDAMLDKNPESLTVAAGVATGIKDFASNLTGLINIIPGVDPSSLELRQSEWTEKLEAVAGDNKELQTIIFNVALASAVADGFGNQRLTDDQLEYAIDQVGGANMRSPKSLRRKLKETAQRLRNNLVTALEFQSGNYESMDSIGEENPSNNSVIEEIRRRESGGK